MQSSQIVKLCRSNTTSQILLSRYSSLQIGFIEFKNVTLNFTAVQIYYTHTYLYVWKQNSKVIFGKKFGNVSYVEKTCTVSLTLLDSY